MSASTNTMPLPVNLFKRAIARRDTQIGLWLATGDGYLAEMIAGTGYDWLLIDGEHAPNDLRSTLAQLQGIGSAAASLPPGSSAPHPAIRLPVADATLVKQYMELGAQTLLVPMVDTPEQALEMARAMRYPPDGSRGVGSGLARSSRWSGYPDYLHEANEQACLLVQVESVEAIKRIDEIASASGVDGVFIGPSDLAASLGLRGQTSHPEVRASISHCVERIHRAGKPSGILATVETEADRWLGMGVSFAAVGVDVSLLSRAAKALATRFKGQTRPVSQESADGGY